MPESVRWLLGQDRAEEVVAILTSVAKSNGKTLAPEVRELVLANGNVEASKTVITKSSKQLNSHGSRTSGGTRIAPR